MIRNTEVGAKEQPTAPHHLKSLHPLWFIGLAVVLGTLPALLSTSALRNAWKQNWILSPGDYLLQLLGFGLLAAGVVLALRKSGIARRMELDEVHLARLERLATVLFWLTVLAYAVWFISALFHGFGPGTMLSILAGKPGVSFEARDAFVTIPGVTTFTQMGPVAVASYTVLFRYRIKHTIPLIILFGLAAARLVANSERLALIEVVLPALIVLALVPAQRGRREANTPKHAPGLYFVSWALAGLTVLTALFAISERSRSFSEKSGGGSLWGYTIERLLGYYATATNNGAHYLHHVGPTLARPETTLDWLWQFPVVGGLFARLVGGRAPGFGQLWPAYLQAHSNPELNSPSFILPVFAEWGYILAPVVLIAVGFAIGRVYRATKAGSLAALLTYSVLVVGLMEIPRFFYFGLGRTAPLLLACFVAKLVLDPSARMTRAMAAMAWAADPVKNAVKDAAGSVRRVVSSLRRGKPRPPSSTTP